MRRHRRHRIRRRAALGVVRASPPATGRCSAPGLAGLLAPAGSPGWPGPGEFRPIGRRVSVRWLSVNHRFPIAYRDAVASRHAAASWHDGRHARFGTKALGAVYHRLVVDLYRPGSGDACRFRDADRPVQLSSSRQLPSGRARARMPSPEEDQSGAVGNGREIGGYRVLRRTAWRVARRDRRARSVKTPGQSVKTPLTALDLATVTAPRRWSDLREQVVQREMELARGTPVARIVAATARPRQAPALSRVGSLVVGRRQDGAIPLPDPRGDRRTTRATRPDERHDRACTPS